MDDTRTASSSRNGGGALAALLAVTVVVTGFLTATLGPLMAVACGSCQDGVRGSLRFDDALIALAHYGVPLTTAATLVAMLVGRRSVRTGVVGLGVLVALIVVMLVLGRLTT